eukprot:GHVU01053105.1.p2 GENE.GHVU01053105.1~~GHVU01053105.1.p2  ORF type:complete len:153 (-),score=6.10 GHVU01053105.1:511-969(-)
MPYRSIHVPAAASPPLASSMQCSWFHEKRCNQRLSAAGTHCSALIIDMQERFEHMARCTCPTMDRPFPYKFPRFAISFITYSVIRSHNEIVFFQACHFGYVVFCLQAKHRPAEPSIDRATRHTNWYRSLATQHTHTHIQSLGETDIISFRRW